ncbi:RidA family protein [Acuticoccus sp. MNP-M23]|uniref:RidA family protein n=1 Tax=Acuticoccus sp. MNP-M23 TaxID=3072793 RepID=UPI002814C6BA|nr:RidA family protein [Acuticoccus sp. MNP-M23]WMS41254.1 RidA family protein [Acuticoccus sp. MNP-M23]
MAERLNPPSLYDSVQYGFSHAAVSGEGRTIHCAGQVAWDKDHNLVGAGDLAAQTRQIVKNLKAVLEAAGAGPADVVRIRTYVVDHTPDKLGTVGAEMAGFWGDVTPAPNTWIGVSTLALPDFMIEIEATAVVSS